MINLILAMMGAEEPTLKAAIDSAGVGSNLKLCFDAADIASYTGSGQKWLDTSGNGYDLFRGTTSASQSSDPTFNGTAGRTVSGTYWSFDGGDQFTYDSANETFMEALHKDSAAYSAIAAVYLPSLSNDAGLFGTSDIVGAGEFQLGMHVRFQSNRTPALVVSNASGTALTKAAATALSASNWHIVGISVDEAGGNVSFFYLDGAYNQVSGSNTFDAGYSSPSSSAATSTFAVGTVGSLGAMKMPSGCRIGFFGLWSSALTKAQFDKLYAILRLRYGLS